MPPVDRRTFCTALAALTLAGCGAAPAGTPASTPTRPAPGLRYGDSGPVRFTGRPPARYPVHGIDAARFQAAADWPTARAAGIRFAWLKATEGGDLLDLQFREHWRGATRAGIPRGAYHFYYFCTPPEVQARWFIRNVPKRRGMLPPVLDMEWNAFSPTCRKRPPGTEVRRQARIFLDILTAHYGQRPVIYTTPGFYRDTGIGRLTGEEFWLRATAETPAQAYPGQAWRFWQYTGTGIVPGFADEVDINVFNGSEADWQTWLAARQVT